MRFPVKLRQLPGRITTGAYILNSGLQKRSADEAAAKGYHGMASGAYPFLGSVEPKRFVKLLSTGEIVVGGALLAPVVPTKLAAALLAGFSGGLVGMYLRTPALHEPGSVRPTQAGIGVSKDIWMLGIAAGLLLDELLDRRSAD